MFGRLIDGGRMITVDKPKWSIMIPVYNCDEYLKICLKSVLSQDFGSALMQIEVVDDCSTKGNPELIVKEFGKGRVDFYRKEKNEGAIANFNTCLKRSKGELVHILHGDDWIENGFYSAINDAVNKYPDIALYASRTNFVDQRGEHLGVSNRRYSYEESPNDDLSIFWEENPLQFAGVVFRKSFINQVGNFDTNLIHCADWDMWLRLVQAGKGIILEQALSNYRIFDGNDSSKLYQTAENFKDMMRMSKKFMSIESFPLAQFKEIIFQRALNQMQIFEKRKNKEAMLANLKFAISIAPNNQRLSLYFKYLRLIIFS